MRALHIITIAFAAVMLLFTMRSYLKHRRLGTLVFWCVVWIAAIIATLLFDTLKAYTEAINVRVFDFIVVLAFLLTFAVLYRLQGRLEQLGGKMEEIVAAVAMQDAGVPKRGGKRGR